MQFDDHERFRQWMDEALASGSPIDGNGALREHLHCCTVCAEYLENSSRVITGLSGYSFAMDSALEERVAAALSQRAQQLEATPLSPKRWALISIGAVVLTIVGSLVDLRIGRVIASTADVQWGQVRQALFAFWIVPSVCVLLLFALLPLLWKTGIHREGRAV